MKQNKIYQPDTNHLGQVIGHETADFYSFQVWREKSNLLKDFPNCSIKEYDENDIEEPTFMDESPQPVTESKETKPLYKRLNEERTQGNWGNDGCAIDSDQFEICVMSTGAKDQDGNTIKWAECEANAQYTALAVNHLHLLAEALETLTKEVSLKGLNVKKDFSLMAAHAQALTALHNIS